MSASKKMYDDEEEHDWHTLPGSIGDAIIADAPWQSHSGGYAVTKSENGTITIYRQIEQAKDVDELENEGDAMLEWYDYVTSNEEVATIPAPEGGWDEETRSLPESIFDGFE